MSTARFIIGDSLTVLRSMPDASVDLVLTSPPFLALRSYLPADHPDKALEMGSEPTPGAFIDALLTLTGECRRVLAPHGTLCVELGDTYAGSGGAGGDYLAGGWREGERPFTGSAKHARVHDPSIGPPIQNKNGKTQGGGAGWPLDKSLCLIPELYRIALVYGFNPLTGRQTPRWRARNVIRWCRPNPPVGALGDKFRPATSEMVVACVGRKRYFDLDAVRTAHKEPAPSEATAVSRKRALNKGAPGNHTEDADAGMARNSNGAPPLDHWWYDDVFEQDAWLIPTEGFKGSHYATWPSDLLVRPIKAMCPMRVCRTCGMPSERVVERESLGLTSSVGSAGGGLARLPKSEVGYRVPDHATRTTLGWTDCGHDDWRLGVVLDPFAGSGTTLAVATGHGRDAIGIDLDERNADLAAARVGMFLAVEHFTDLAPA